MYENAISNRYEFIMLYDVENGNPNGDPDAGNTPRSDPETGHGIVTDVCIKRKIRNYIDFCKQGEPGYNIYIKQDVTLNGQDQIGLDAVKEINDRTAKSNSFREFMCSHFYDVRTFGAVIVTAARDQTLLNTSGQVRGPVQITFGRSIDPIMPQEITITRVAVTKEEKSNASTEMGRKHIVPYGLYRQEGFISANLAQKVTGFSEEDLRQFWNAVIHMFDEDHSAARGKMNLRELIVFKHDCIFGNAPYQKLFDLVEIKLIDGVTSPRKYSDYNVSVDTNTLPEGVTLERMV